ncbi:MAG: NAD+ synthase [Alphaproteobacteria bacterium]|nr:NAD+ synthase [Alphaproteobacteria bacterium]
MTKTLNSSKKKPIHIAPLKITLGQFCTDTAHFAGNQARALTFAKQHPDADLLLLPELFLNGYPVDDLLHHPDFIQQNNDALHNLAQQLHAINAPALIIGAAHYETDGADGDDKQCFNALYLLHNGKPQHLYNKYQLPNYGVFDEERHFSKGSEYGTIFEHQGYKIGLMICEDSWYPDGFARLTDMGADIILLPNASPFADAKHKLQRLTRFTQYASDFAVPIVYLNRVGARDDLIFDGASFAINHQGKIILQMPSFTEATATMSLCNTDLTIDNAPPLTHIPNSRLHDIYHAIVMAVKDYARHNGFTKIVLGLSGGIDSALVATIAADAVGGDNLHCLLMPSEFTAKSSIDDAVQCAKNLGAHHHILDIKKLYQHAAKTLAPAVGKPITDGITHENLQARARGMLLMGFSNHQGALLLATSNKSESACGYATLYGDMCGGYAPIQDVYKTDIFALSQWRNQCTPNTPPIPQNIITKPPSAELRANQKDSDSLPDYPILDSILYHMIEEETPHHAIIAMLEKKHIENAPAIVSKVWTMLQNSEYKRKQAPPCPKISLRALGTDRRYPITSYFTVSSP